MEWRDSNAGHSAPLEGFLPTVSAEEVCVGACTADLRLHGDTEGRCGDWAPTVAKFLHHFQLACRIASPTKVGPTILLCFDDCEDNAHPEYILVANSSYANGQRFEATFFRMVPAGPSPAFGHVDRAPPPVLLRYDCQVVATGFWPCVGSEAELARRLLARSPRWEICLAVNRRTDSGSLSRLDTAAEPCRYENLLQREDKQK